VAIGQLALAGLARQARDRLQERCGLDTRSDARIEAELLLAYSLGCTRTQLFAQYTRVPTPEEAVDFETLLQRRLQGEPLAYITGHCEFYGLDLVVTPDVLIPRPETEQMVSMAMGELVAAQRRRRAVQDWMLADIGTGSGAIAVALACRLPRCKVYAVDVSEAALAVARNNSARHGVTSRTLFRRGDLLAPVAEPVDAILANLPYIPTEDMATLQVEVRDFEPRQALDGGPDGLDLYRQLLPQVPRLLQPGGFLICEIGVGQAGVMRQIAERSFPRGRITLHPDFAGIPRMLRVETPGGA
jgi:release factor glutamine methyltransferase